MVAHVLTWHIMRQQRVKHCQQYQELHVSYEKDTRGRQGAKHS